MALTSPSRAPDTASTAVAAVARAGVSGRRRGVLGRAAGSERATGLLLSGPAIAYFAVFWVVPFGFAVYYSFTNYNLFTPPQWVGAHDYTTLFSNPTFTHSLAITALFVVVTVVPTIALALLLAAPVSRGGRVFGVYRAVILVPAVMPLVASAIVWTIMFQPNGLANSVIGFFGFSPVPWLTGTNPAFWAVVIMSIWKYLGFYFLIILAGLQTIPRNLYDAAAIDGASSFRVFARLTLPLIRRTLAFVTVIGLIAAAQSFVPAFMLTSGGPSNATDLLPLYLYKVGFADTNMGAASAISIVMTVVLVVVALVQYRIIQGRSSVAAR